MYWNWTVNEHLAPAFQPALDVLDISLRDDGGHPPSDTVSCNSLRVLRITIDPESVSAADIIYFLSHITVASRSAPAVEVCWNRSTLERHDESIRQFKLVRQLPMVQTANWRPCSHCSEELTYGPSTLGGS